MAEGIELIEIAFKEAEGLAEDVVAEGMANIAEGEAENLALITTRESAEDFCRDVVQQGGTDAPSITATASRAANREVQTALEQTVVDGAAEEGVSNATTEVLNKPLRKGGKEALEDLTTDTLGSPERTSRLKADIANPPSRVRQIFEGIKNNWGKLLVSGCTVAVVVVWLSTGHTLQDLIDSVGNVIDDLGKNLIGALAGIARSLTDPIGTGIGGALKNVGISVAIAGGIALLVVAIYYGIRKARENTTGKSKIQ